MNTIKIYLTESGRIADLQKDFPLYQGQFQNKLLNVFVPTSILAPIFTSSGAVSADYVASTSTKIGMTYTARDGSIKVSKNYYMRYLKTLMYKGVEYALYERKLPKEFTFYAGQGENSPVLIINVVNIEQQSGDTPPLVLSVITSQTCHLDVMQSTFLDRDELNEPSELENLNAQVQALNALMPKKQDKEDENIALEQAPAEKTVVGAINELGGLVKTAQSSADTAQQTAETAQTTADNATTLANNAVATANGAVATANEAKTTAQTAENNANSAVDTANAANATADEAKAIAQGSQRAIGFATLQAAITALNGYSNTQLKVGDNVYIVETGVPDLWVAAVEQNSVAYNYTTNDAFNDDLVENTLVQVGYYKFAYLESDGKPCTVAWQNMTVAASDWVASTEFEDFAYEAKIALSDFVNFSSIPQVVFGLTEATSGNYAPICKAGDKGVYIYSKVNTSITLPTVVTFAPNVHGASMQGGGYTNKGKWVASTTYAIDDLVYTDNGQFVCIEGITSTTSPEQDTTHWQATFVATGKTKNTLTISGQDNGTEVQKTFDGSTAVEIAFDETTMTAKEVDGVLKVGAKGTVPEALPQEASALKSGSLPTIGWVTGAFKAYWQGETVCGYDSPTLITTNKAFADKCWASDIAIMLKSSTSSFADAYSSNAITWAYDSTSTVNDETARVYEYSGDKIYVTQTGKIYGKGYTNGLARHNLLYVVKLGFADEAEYNYTISDTSITVNSDVLMELTDDGGVRALSIEVGKMTVVRDSIPTNNIPYTYKIKQTNASGQFTLVNHFVPSIPESPTSLPVSYKKASGSLPTSGWTEVTTPNLIWEGTQRVDAKGAKDIYNSSLSFVPTSEMKADTEPTHWQYKKSDGTWASVQRIYTTDGTYNGLFLIITPNGEAFSGYEFLDGTNFMRIKNGYTSADNFYGIRYVGFTQRTYTISDGDITANTSVKMYLTDEGGVKAYSKAVGSIQVIRDTVPTTAIPYEYEVEETSAEGLFEVINAYVPAVPTKTSQLTNDSGFAKTTEANTFTGVQTFSNADGIKTDRVHNLENNDAWYNFDGSNNRFGSPSRPTIIRTSEARPRAQVPSGKTTVTKEIALLEDTKIKGEWSEYTYPNVTLTESGLYQIWAPSSSTASEHWEAFVYWDGTSLTKKQMFVNYYQSNDSEQTDVQRIYLYVANIRITNAGVLSIEEFNTKYSLEGALISSSSSNAGFKYRKIN